MKLNKSKDKRTMTIYENIRNSKAAACIITALMMTASCTQDDMATDGGAGLLAPDETSGIFISDTGTGTSATRAFVEPNDETTGPQVEGICRADKMDVYVFKEHSYNFPKEEELSYKNTLQPEEVKVFGNDRYAECTAKIEHESGSLLANYTYVLSSALAYSEADKSLFNVNLEGFNRTNVPLTLQNDNGKYKTPELFYGIVKGKGDISSDEDKFPNGFYWNGNKNKNKTVTFYGRIFRIVSQLNLHITDISSEAIKKIELYGDNYPTEIILYGTHGAFYPVTSASTTTGEAPAGDNPDLAQSGNYVLLDSKDIAGGTEEITLSTFLLPSEKGMHLKMRVYFHNDTDQGNDGGTNPEYKDYDIRPDRSYLLDDGAATYTVADDLHYESEASSPDDLYIYDSRNGKLCFYSYSNVRVNMSGKLEDIAGESSTSNITIEVEPGFEKVHKIPLGKN